MTPERYIRSLRSPAKRAYAEAYLAWLRSGAATGEPDRGQLSYMAAQAVRLELGYASLATTTL